jgi:hypothetical protein
MRVRSAKQNIEARQLQKVKQIVKQLRKQETLREQNPQNLASNSGVPGATRTRDPLLRR